MPDPINTLIDLNAITLACDEVQALIDLTRVRFADDQLLQLEMDRKQTQVDNRRSLVEAIKFDIARRN